MAEAIRVTGDMAVSVEGDGSPRFAHTTFDGTLPPFAFSEVRAPDARSDGCTILPVTNVARDKADIWGRLPSHDAEHYEVLKKTLLRLVPEGGTGVDFMCGCTSLVGVRLGVDASRNALLRNPLVELGLVWDLNDSRAQLPIPAESFDYALCVSGVGYLSDVRRAVCEMHRVVKPGGSLVLGFDHQFVSSAVDPRWAVTTQDDRIRTVKLALADAACVTPEECTTYLRRVRHARPIEEWKYTFLQVRKPL